MSTRSRGDFDIDERRFRLTDLRDGRLLGRWTHEDDDDVSSVRFGPRFDRVIVTMPDRTTTHFLFPVFVIGYLDREALAYAPLTGKREVVPWREGPSAGFFQPVYFHDAARCAIDAHVTAEVTLGEHESRFVLRRGDHVLDELTYPRVSGADFFMWLASRTATDWLRERFTT